MFSKEPVFKFELMASFSYKFSIFFPGFCLPEFDQTVASSGKSRCVFPGGVVIDICISYAHFRKGRMLKPYGKSKIFI